VIGLFVGPLMMAILFGWLRDGQPQLAQPVALPVAAPVIPSEDARRID